MSEIVERVARALAAADCEWQDTPGAQVMGWSETLSRAAIEVVLHEAAGLADPGGDIALHKLEEAVRRV